MVRARSRRGGGDSAPVDQRRQPPRRRQRQDAGRRAYRAAAARARRAAGDSDAADTRGASLPTASRSCPTARACSRRHRRRGRRTADAGARAARRRRCSSAPTGTSRAGWPSDELGATVHLLDDGFQHLQLARDVDLLVVAERRPDRSLLPAGRLREPLTAAVARRRGARRRRTGDGRGARRAQALGVAIGLPRDPRARRAAYGLARRSRSSCPGTRVFARGRHRASRALLRRSSGRRAGSVVGTMAFRDHHPYRQRRRRRASPTRRARRAPTSC